MEVIVGDFGLEWKYKDGEIHKADYDDLTLLNKALELLHMSREELVEVVNKDKS